MGYYDQGRSYVSSYEPPIPHSYFTGQLKYPNRASRFITFRQDNINVPTGQSHVTIVDETETGELIGFMAILNNKDVVLQVITTGDDNTQFAVSDFTTTDLVRFGLGLAPGDVPILPSGESADTSGVPNGVFPWCARFKDETTADINGDTARRFAIVYTPNQYPPYKKISVKAINPSTSSCMIVQFRMVRVIYETLPSEYDKPTGQIEPGSV